MKPMKNKYVLYYDGGHDIARIISEALGAESVEIPAGGTAEAFSLRWNDAGVFVFVGALAIAVRAVASLLRDKADDPALVVVSEDGAVVIPVVSGHMGGASDFARECSGALSTFGAMFVPTTSSDRSGFVAPDLWASRRGWHVLLRSALASVIRKLTANGEIFVWVDPVLSDKGITFPLPAGYTVTRTQSDSDLIISPRSIQKLVGAKPQIVPRVLTVGIGCRRGTGEDSLERILKKALTSCPEGPFLMEALREFRSSEIKANESGLLSLVGRCALPLSIVSDDEMRAIEGNFSPSAAEKHLGLPGVAEPAAASAGKLLGPRLAEEGVTVALSMSIVTEYGELSVVGTGPGDARFMTAEAKDAILASDVVVGYKSYIDMLPPSWLRGKIVERYGMGEEEDRVRSSIVHAESGYNVALISGGDPSLFGLAPLALTMAPDDMKLKVLPGITAAQAAGKIVGAPYSNGLVLLSLSDYLQPWNSVVRAMEGAETSSLTVAVYNPVSRNLAEKLDAVRTIFSRRRLILVRDAGRPEESMAELPVEKLDESLVDMRTLLLFLSPAARDFPAGAGRKKLWVETRGYKAEQIAGHAQKLSQFLVLGGTSEGRLIASHLIDAGYSVTVSVTRETGLATVPDGADAMIGPKDEADWIDLFEDIEASSELLGVIDATHPFASEATAAIKNACDRTGAPLCRFTRPESIPEGAILTDSPQNAAGIAVELTNKGDMIFLSVGVNMLPKILPRLREAERGVLARILPASESLAKAERAGLAAKETVAVWGAGGADLNAALCAENEVKCVISKASGDAGGINAKAEAASRLDIPLVLISRPEEPGGLLRVTSIEELLNWCGEKK
jgi:cobalt-precorrin 5A hydrolase/precorrin-3B C17-methyltransferase